MKPSAVHYANNRRASKVVMSPSRKTHLAEILSHP